MSMEVSLRPYRSLRVVPVSDRSWVHPPLIRTYRWQHQTQSRQNFVRSPRRIAVASASSNSRTAGQRRIKLPSPLLPSYSRVGSCFAVVPPGVQIKGIVAFFGGAFIGATPDAFYGHLLDLISRAGYLVLAVPYDVTFDHRSAAAALASRLSSALSYIANNETLPGTDLHIPDPSSLPLYGVGHSNGALMQMMMGSLFSTAPYPAFEANVIISFNNRPASYAVPFFDQVGPAIRTISPAISSFPLTGIALAAAEQLLETIERMPPPSLPAGLAFPLPLSLDDVNINTEPLSRFAAQIVPVVSQVIDGVSEFSPTPKDNQSLFRSSYAVPKNLIIKFSNDAIDESDKLEEALRSSTTMSAGVGAGNTDGFLVVEQLPGTHLTPLAQDIVWPVEREFSPADAVAMAVKLAALADLKRLAKATTDFLDSF